MSFLSWHCGRSVLNGGSKILTRSALLQRAASWSSTSFRQQEHSTIRSTRTMTMTMLPVDLSMVRTKTTMALPTSSRYAVVSSRDGRATVKLGSLTSARASADALRRNPLHDEDDARIAQAEARLALAYAQAIKYVARTGDPDSAASAQSLLEEAVARATMTTGPAPLAPDDSFGGGVGVPALLRRLASREFPARDNDDPASSCPPPPSRDSFHHVLHAWAASKVKKKGFKAESLLAKMAESSKAVNNIDLMPDSKAFALTLKAHAGSTHAHSSLDRILDLHKAHEAFATHKLPNIHLDDPFFLMYSLKSLKNYHRPREAELALSWFHRLHSHVMNYNDHESTNNDDNNETSPRNPVTTIDLTGTYTTVIRELARSNRHDSSKYARAVLDGMHKLADRGDKNTVARVEIRVNAYNLVLSAYKTYDTPPLSTKDKGRGKQRHNNQSAEDAVALLDDMIAVGWKQRRRRQRDHHVPAPTEQSFEVCLGVLGSHADADWVHAQAQRLLGELESMYARDDDDEDGPPLRRTTLVYNALLQLYRKTYASSPLLLPRVVDVVARMKHPAASMPSLTPDAVTMSLVLSACANAPPSDTATDLAQKTFARMKDADMTTDLAVHYMMRVTVINDPSVPDGHDTTAETSPPATAAWTTSQATQDAVSALFADACDRGLVSYHVLETFRANVPADVFAKTVGDGRLADDWVRHVTSRRVAYTDGTNGGAGKNARRKGKSTSDWVRKDRARNEGVETRLRQKRERKAARRLRRSNMS